jgi:raffinose synthase
MHLPSSSSLEDVRPFLVAVLLVQFSLSVILSSSSEDNTAMGFGAMAFARSKFHVTAGRSASTVHRRRRVRQQHGGGWQYATTPDGVLAATPVLEEDFNATYVDIGFPESSFEDESLSPPLPATADVSSETPSMTLVREGNRLKLSTPTLSDQQPTIYILDGLSTETWTAVKPPTVASSSSTSSSSISSSFSSLVLQTRVPSVAIQSLSLGNFLVPIVASADQQQQHKHKFLAASRLNRYWMGPKFGGDASDTDKNDDRTEIPVDTQYLLVEVEREEGLPPYYAVMMPLVDGGYRSSLEPSSSTIGENFDDTGHKLTLVSYSESGDSLSLHDPTAMRNALYVAIHDDPYELLRLAFREVSGVLGGTFKTLEEKQIPSEFVNSFGWCSWDAFYSKVHPTGILEGIKCLSDAGIPVKNVILDDGWQQVSPPYLHQQEEADNKKTSSLAASLSLSGSSDVMPPPDSNSSLEIASMTSSGAAVATIPQDQVLADSSAMAAIASSFQAVVSAFQNPLDTLANIGGSIFGVIATGVTNCYQKYVENAPLGSFPNRLWTFLARYSPLNYGLWEFFDSETDFGRQLNDCNPNWKFLEENEESSSSSSAANPNMALKELVTTLKEDWNVNKVYCWHSIHGYWRGVSDDLGKSIGIEVTQVKTRPSDHIMRIEPEMAYDPPSLFGVGLIGKKEDISKFYKHLHEPLVAAGVDGVKVDVQSGITAAGMRGKGIADCPPLAKLYTQTMEESVAERFPSDSNSGDAGAVECINCMCHSTENLYRYKTTAVARASDDFYPARPESHSVHLVNVAYNSLFLGEICLPDWDMFHSKHASAELHAAARAIGGCPVYVSDVPGKHNVPLLRKLVLPDGSVLRAKKAGRPTRDCIFADVGKDGTSALKIWNTNHESSSSHASKARRGGVIGAFNVQGVAWNWETNENQVLDASPPPVTAVVKPYDVDSLRNIDGPFAVWSHRTKSLKVLPMGGSAIETTLDPRGWEIFTIQPVQQQQTEKFYVQWAPIGLGHMLNSGGAILDVGRLGSRGDDAADDDDERIHAEITTRGPGSFVSYCHPRPSSVLIRNAGVVAPKQLDFRHHPESGLLEFDLPPETIEGKAHLVTVIWGK